MMIAVTVQEVRPIDRIERLPVTMGDDSSRRDQIGASFAEEENE